MFNTRCFSGNCKKTSAVGKITYLKEICFLTLIIGGQLKYWSSVILLKTSMSLLSLQTFFLVSLSSCPRSYLIAGRSAGLSDKDGNWMVPWQQKSLELLKGKSKWRNYFSLLWVKSMLFFFFVWRPESLLACVSKGPCSYLLSWHWRYDLGFCR